MAKYSTFVNEKELKKMIELFNYEMKRKGLEAYPIFGSDIDGFKIFTITKISGEIYTLSIYFMANAGPIAIYE